MTYLYWYWGIGVVVLALMWTFNRLTKNKDGNSFNDLMADRRPVSKSLWVRLPNDVLIPALVSTLIALFWPVILYFEVKERVFSKRNRVAIDEPEFAVTHDDLQTQLSMEEIEQQEIVFDRLGGAPNVPFGHLNTAWKKFCEGMEPLDNLWSFSAHWSSAWSGRELRQGYVIVRGEVVGRHFITVWKDVEEELNPKAIRGKTTERLDLPAWLQKQAE